MLFLLSPAKALDYSSPLDPSISSSQPIFQAQAGELMAALKKLSTSEVGELMDLSDKLAVLNAERYAAWRPKPSADMVRPAALAFNGDVYEGLDAKTLNAAQLQWLNAHLRILSGLYGVLRPLDDLQPYRLEMGTRFGVGGATNLYQYWQKRIAPHLNEVLAAGGHQVLVNLASTEYFKAVDVKQLKVPVLECRFEEYKNGQYKVISFAAKRARGLMMRWATQQQVQQAQDLREFGQEGYAFAPQCSTAAQLVFRRSAIE
jgi:hypothetical protein